MLYGETVVGFGRARMLQGPWIRSASRAWVMCPGARLGDGVDRGNGGLGGSVIGAVVFDGRGMSESVCAPPAPAADRTHSRQLRYHRSDCIGRIYVTV